MPSDFVTVPVFWVKMWWEPTAGQALLVSLLSTANDVFYYMLLVAFPLLGWSMLATAFYYLRFGKDARARSQKIPDIQRSEAKSVRLTMRHDSIMHQGSARGSLVELSETDGGRSDQCLIDITVLSRNSATEVLPGDFRRANDTDQIIKPNNDLGISWENNESAQEYSASQTLGKAKIVPFKSTDNEIER